MKKITAAAVAATGLVALYSIINDLVFYEIMDKRAKIPGMINAKMKSKVPAYLKKDPRSEWAKAQPFEGVTIKNVKGQTLQGWYLPSAKKSDIFVIGSHGYRSRGRGEFRFISKFYHENGYNLFLIDHAGSGDSEGHKIGFGAHESRDLLLWVDYLRNRFGNDIKIILHGVSMGAATVCLASKSYRLLPQVKFAISDCAYTSVKAQFKNVLGTAKVPAFPLLPTVSLTNKLFDGHFLGSISPVESVKNAKIPMLFIHGKKDGFVFPDMCEDLFDACSTEKDILLVDHAGHGDSYRKNPDGYEQKIKEFTEKYCTAK